MIPGSRRSDLTAELDILLRARVPLIVIPTAEEIRALAAIQDMCASTGRKCCAWDIASGFTSLVGTVQIEAPDPITCLERIASAPDDKVVYILKDFHEFWKDTRVKRLLRNASQNLRMTQKSIIVISPESRLPRELGDEAVLVDLDPPGTDEIEAVLDRLSKMPDLRTDLTTTGRQRLVQAALGLSLSQAERVFSKAIVSDGVLDDRDIDLVTSEKKQIIRDSEALEFHATTETPDDVGGLDILKEWLRLRERALTAEARQYGLPSPKGVALIGIPGSGKSLTAKMIANAWHLPLLRLDHDLS